MQRARAWTAPKALVCFALGLVFFGALILQERSVLQPMLPLQLFGSPILTMSILVTGFTSVVVMALVILVPLGYQLVSSSFLAGQAVAATGRHRLFSILGAAVATAMCLLTACVDLGHSVLDTVATLLLGLSFGCQFLPMTMTLENAVDPRDGGIAISCMMVFRLIGGAFGVAVLSSVLLWHLPGGQRRWRRRSWRRPSPSCSWPPVRSRRCRW